jgi:hypothetical protein
MPTKFLLFGAGVAAASAILHARESSTTRAQSQVSSASALQQPQQALEKYLTSNSGEINFVPVAELPIDKKQESLRILGINSVSEESGSISLLVPFIVLVGIVVLATAGFLVRSRKKKQEINEIPNVKTLEAVEKALEQEETKVPQPAILRDKTNSILSASRSIRVSQSTPQLKSAIRDSFHELLKDRHDSLKCIDFIDISPGLLPQAHKNKRAIVKNILKSQIPAKVTAVKNDGDILGFKSNVNNSDPPNVNMMHHLTKSFDFGYGDLYKIIGYYNPDSQ